MGGEEPRKAKKKKSQRRRTTASHSEASSGTGDNPADPGGKPKRKKKSSKSKKSQERDVTDGGKAGGGPGKKGGAEVVIEDIVPTSVRNLIKERANSERANENGREHGRGKGPKKQTSFSDSTIARELEKDGQSPSAKAVEGYSAPVAGAVEEAPQSTSHALAVAMGKMPPGSSFNNIYDSVMTEKSAESETSVTVESADPQKGSKSALKPSRYSGNKATSPVNEEAEPNVRVSHLSFQLDDYSSADDEKSDEDAPRIARRIRQAPPQKDGLSDDADNEPPKWNPRNKRANKKRPMPRRSISNPNVNQEALGKAPQRKGSWKPEGLAIGKQRGRSKLNKPAVMMRRSSSGIPGDDEDSYGQHRDFENSIQGSLTIPPPRRRSSGIAERPGIRQRSNMGGNLSSRRLSFAPRTDPNRDSSGTTASAPSDEKQPRRTMLYNLKSAADAQQQRRIAMSSEYQTYIPPKSRNSSVLQACGHLLAGRTIDVTLWTYSAGFLKVMLFFLVIYILNIFIWAAVLDAVDLATGGRCIHEDAELLAKGERLEFVFELAWATFTTVGYGTISPKGDVTGCYMVRFTCAFVAFIGVIFASQTAAIIYSKLMRLLAQAPVTFSSTLCVQYGEGNRDSTVRFGQLNFRASVAPAQLAKSIDADDILNDDGQEEDPGGSEDGFPVIEFRMINDRANSEGSEIWDAQIRGIVQLQKEQPSDESKLSRSIANKDRATGGESTLDLEKKVYYPISLSPDSHPHFSRIWYARHVLNAESPLLKREIRDQIVQDGNKWDKDFNDHEEIRDCLNEFISLRITLSGTSAVSASDVYGEHVYQFDDVCVGWRFANMVYEQRAYEGLWRSLRLQSEKENVDITDTNTKIDADLLHDIVPQPGGNHEPLVETRKSKTRKIKALLGRDYSDGRLNLQHQDDGLLNRNDNGREIT